MHQLCQEAAALTTTMSPNGITIQLLMQPISDDTNFRCQDAATKGAHEIHETCHSVTFYFMSELIF